MKLTIKILTVLTLLIIIGCGGKEEKKESIKLDDYSSPASEVKKEAPETTTKASETINLEDKGIGPVKSVTLAPEIDQEMVAHGKEIYAAKCTACHRPDKKFIGPPPTGVLERRTPEWVMNMILNPDVMIQKDPLAKNLLMEFNGSPMANQNLTEEEARAVLEYFRTLN